MRKTSGARLVLVQMELGLILALAQVLIPLESKEVSEEMMTFSQTCGNSISCLNACYKIACNFFHDVRFLRRIDVGKISPNGGSS